MHFNRKVKVSIVGIKLTDEMDHKRIEKDILQNDDNNISSSKHGILHWSLMITKISVDVLSKTIITEIYHLDGK